MLFESFDTILKAAKKNMHGKDDRRFATESLANFKSGKMLTYKVGSGGFIDVRQIKPGNFYTYVKKEDAHRNSKSPFSDRTPVVLWLGYILVDREENGVKKSMPFGLAIDLNLVPPMPYGPHRLLLFNRLAWLFSDMFAVNAGKKYSEWKPPKNQMKLRMLLDGNKPDLAIVLRKFCMLTGLPLPPPNIMVVSPNEITNLKAIDWTEILNLYYLFIPANLKFADGYNMAYFTNNLFKKGTYPKKMVIT